MPGLSNPLDQQLAQQRQRLGFEPPRFGGGGTIGGAVAAGLSGPVRPFAGAARDFVLGAEFINGTGELIQSGGRVIKNVAGYDVARLMAGALGTLGVITQLSLRVVTVAEKEHYLYRNLPLADVPAWMSELGRRPLPLSGLAWLDGVVRVRLAGTAAGVEAAVARLGLPTDEAGADFWSGLRDQTLPFFVKDDAPLWRLSHRPAAQVAELDGAWLIDWGGAQRWLRSREPSARVRAAAAAQSGHATLFRGGDRQGEVFQRPAAALWRLQENVKRALDPAGVFNPGRLYADL